MKMPGWRGSHLIEIGRLALDDGQGAGRALAKAGAKPVAQHVGGQFGLAVDDAERPFDTRWHALTAAIAEFFVYFDDVPNGHKRILPHGVGRAYDAAHMAAGR